MPDRSEIAKKLMEVIPQIMHSLRWEMRQLAREEMTVPQFRILAHLDSGLHTTGALAEMQGISAPAMSKMMVGLAARGFVTRTPGKADRREVELQLTRKGKTAYFKIRNAVQLKLGEQMATLAPRKLADLKSGLSVLEEMFHGRKTL